MYGSRSEKITLEQTAYEKYCGRKAYYTAFSKYGIVSDDFPINFHSADRNFAQVVAGIQPHRITGTGDNTFIIQAQKDPKQYTKTRAHLYAYVL